MISARLDESILLGLAPGSLPNLRVSRYEGDAMAVRMADFGVDGANVAVLYAALSRLLGALREALAIPEGDGTAPGGFSNGSPDLRDPSAEQVAAAREVLLRTAADPVWRAAVAAARSIRPPVQGSDADRNEQLRQALHDVRGGALAALALTLDFIAITRASTADVVRAFYLTRDHLKIMRNAVEDVDAPARARDTMQRDHGTQLLFEKWSSAMHRQAGGREARVEVDSTFEGPVSRRCLEFSALDRVLYNLMNNAVRFTTDGTVTLYLRAIGGSLRFIVANAITAEQREILRSSFGDALGTLYLGGFTTGGEGVGLSICGEFVANAYGLLDVREAIADGHVGASIVDRTFMAWFHWPRAS